MKSILKFTSIAMMLTLVAIVSCKEDEPTPAGDPIASFAYTINEANFMEVSFTNNSENAVKYAWDFGDQTASVEENPTHSYTGTGDYTVSLVVENADGKASNTFTEVITITDPNEALKLITGEVSKTWKLFREGTSMLVASDPELTSVYWEGLTNNGTRNCLYEQTFTFGIDGSYVFDDMGMFWAEYGLFNNVGGCDQGMAEACFDVTGGSLTNACGDDISAWLSGSHTFTYESSTGSMNLNGLGAWIGIPKLGTAGERLTPEEVTSFKVSVEEFTGYDVMKVEFIYDGNYWPIYYASYSDASLEPQLPGAFVTADFTFVVNDKEVTFSNISQNATSYSWDFGDGSSASTEENPVYTYAADGDYEVVLTANGENESMKTKTVTIGGPPFTTGAPTPPQAEADVISIYSDAYAALEGLNTNPNWGQATVVTPQMIGDDNLLKMAALNYQGIDWTGTAGGSLDVSSKTMVHVDIWTEGVETINFSVIGGGAENAVTLTTVAGEWKSFDIALTEYPTPDLTATIQFKFDDAGTGTSPTIYVDNMYFY